MICPDCSEEIKDNISYCPFCGYQLEEIKTLEDKDLKIKALEQKIIKLENGPNHNREEMINLKNEIRYMRSQLGPNTRKTGGNHRWWIYCIFFWIFWYLIGNLLLFSPWY